MLRKTKRYNIISKDETKESTSSCELKFFFVLSESCNEDIEKAPKTLRAAYSSYCQHWDKVFDKKSIISESSVLKLNQNEINRNKIFIFAEFDSKAYDYMRTTGALIIGPRCILDCLTNNIPIPISSTPVFTISMRGMIMSISGPSGKQREEIKMLIGYMGGICYDELNSACTHLVASNVSSEKYEIAASRKLKIMHFGWVYDVWTASCDRNCFADDKEFLKNRLPIFYPLCITSTGLTAKARDKIKTLININGGTYEGAFSSERTQILILERTSIGSPKFVTAIKYKKDCLTPQWIFDSVEEGYALGFKPYRVSAMRISTPTKDFMHASSRDFNPNSTQLSDISHAESLRSITINETNGQMSSSSTTIASKTNSSDSRKPTCTAALPEINMSLARKHKGYLDGCKVYLSGFNPESQDKLVKLLNIGGAIRYDELNDQITHVIVGKYMLADKLLIETKNLHPTLLTVDWVVDSLRLGEPAATENFLYKETSTETDEPEQPSPASKQAILSMNHSFKRPVLPPKFNLATLSKRHEQQFTKDIIELQKPRTCREDNNSESSLVKQYLNQHDGFNLLTNANRARQETVVDTEELEELNYLANKSVFLFGFSGETLESLILDCEQAQACIVDEHCKHEVDYVITPVILPNRPIPVKFKLIVSESFIETSIQTNKLPEKLEYYHHPIKYSEDDPKPLTGDIVSFSVYAGGERIYISNMAEVLGAKEEEKFYKRLQPILILPRPEGSKYQAAVKWDLPTVTAKWLLKCFETKTRVSLEPYDVNKLVIQEDTDNTTQRLRPELIPSNTADEIDLYNRSTKEAKADTSENFREFLDDCEKFSQNLFLECNAVRHKDDLVNKKGNDDFVLKHRRLSELQKESTKKRAVSSDSVNSSDISGNVNDLDLDTPTKCLIKKVLHEEAAKETPNTKRLKECIQTPVLRYPITPEVPKFIKTPEELYARYLDDTPNTRHANKRKLEVLDSYYMQCKERRKSTPFSEIHQKFWKSAMGDDEQTDDLQTSNLVMNENVSLTPSFTVPKCQTPISTRGFEKVLKHYGPKPNSAVASTSRAPDDPVKPISINNSSALILDDGLSKVANFIKTRILSDKSKSSSNYHPQKRMLELPVLECQINSEMLSAESQEIEVGWKDSRPKRFCLKKFMFTSMSDEDKLRHMKTVDQLGAECLNMTAGFDDACTHLIFDRPNRGEKVMAAIAAGRWCLVPKYLEDSLDAGKFLEEEEYEWGNPKGRYKQLNMSDIEQNIANSCHNWRSKRTSDNWNGAFKKFRVILHVVKRDAFKRIIIAGGGSVLDTSEPYYNKQDALGATHCFVDGKACSLSDGDAMALKKAGVEVLTINYIYAYLNNENVNISKFSVSNNI